jgi:methyltransferase (TIGR00027 family)
MQSRSSQTAQRAAFHRAAHQLAEGGSVFADPFAIALLGEDPEEIARTAATQPDERIMRLFIAARSRFAEDRLAQAVLRGLRQVVVLGAGLDTFGLRNPHAAKALHVFEVDHPATQAWKRRRLAEAGLSASEFLHFAAIDFERQSLMHVLAQSGFRREDPAFFIWLGVVPYLTRPAIFATLAAIAELDDAAVVFDYAEPPEASPPAQRARLEARMARVAALGEPWLSFFEPDDLARALRAHGFGEIEDLGLGELAARYFAETPIPQETGMAHVLRAGRSAR